MKKKILIITLVLMVLPVYLMGQKGCNGYYPFQKGKSFEITSYNGKGKKESVVTGEVKSIENTSEGLKATIHSTIKPVKGKENFETDYSVTCKDNKIFIDFKSLMNADMFKQYSNDAKVEISGMDVEYPNDLTPGETLPDAEISIKTSMSALSMNVTNTMVNRKVEGNETITTPAGTFQCIVVTYDSVTKVMGIKKMFSHKQWLAKDIGFIKGEMYNAKGKLLGYEELTLLN